MSGSGEIWLNCSVADFLSLRSTYSAVIATAALNAIVVGVFGVLVNATFVNLYCRVRRLLFVLLLPVDTLLTSTFVGAARL